MHALRNGVGPITASNFISRLLTTGGDQRIAVPPGGNVNPYGASPFPRDTLGYAASTANDISAGAFAHLAGELESWPQGQILPADEYRSRLDGLRERLRAAYGLPASVDVVFAPSGTDLEIAALAIAAARAGRPVRNILLGRDEVGSGCALAAQGRYFANQTALCAQVEKGTWIAGLERTEIVDVAVRTPDGAPRAASAVTAEMDRFCIEARRGKCHSLVHVVHGSKTGLTLPDLIGIDALRHRYGDAVTIVVDACQARLSAQSIGEYLARDAIVLLTGSKFMGGPPFSGFALVPPSLAPAAPLPSGLATMVRRAELPSDWRCAQSLEYGANPGLLLRLQAAVFELERYQSLAAADRERVGQAFAGAVQRLSARLGAWLVQPAEADGWLSDRWLATLDLSSLPARPDHATAQLWWRVLAARGIRVGQPVKCVPAGEDRWWGTLRLSLSMPLVVERARLDHAALAPRFDDDMERIAEVLEAAQRRIAA